MRNPKLQLWLDAGIKRFAQNGLKGLNVSEIAKKIGTAPSSFYHFFNTKEDYLKDLIDYWHEQGSMKIIKEVFLEDEPDKAINLLFKLEFENNFIYECFLLQLRAASHDNELFKKKIEETDKLRVSFLTSLLARKGLNEEEAKRKASQIHSYVTGLNVSSNLVERDTKSVKRAYEDLRTIFGLNVGK